MNKIKIIAEIGINHNGDIKIAKDLIDCAKKAGCDIVKFQKRDIDLVYSKEQLNSFRESPWGNTFRQQKEGIEVSKNDYDEINNYCNDINIEWFASAWDNNSQQFLNNYDLKYNKSEPGSRPGFRIEASTRQVIMSRRGRRKRR